jgi:hypothetical protein
MSPPSSGLKSQPSKKPELCLLPFHVGFLPDLIFNHEDACDMFLRNVGWLSTAYTLPYIPEDRTLLIYSSENLNSHNLDTIKKGGWNIGVHSVRILISFRLLCKNAKIEIHIVIILPVVLYGCKSRCLTLMEIHGRNVYWGQNAEEGICLKVDQVTGD